MKKWCLVAFKIGVTIGLLYYIFGITPFAEVIQSISVARLWYVVIAMLTAILTTFVSACRLKILTDIQGMSLSILQITEINLVTMFYGLLLPGHLVGGVIRWHKLSQVEKKKAEAFAAIAFSRLNFMIVLVILGIAFLTLDMSFAPPRVTSLGLFVVLISLCVVYLLAFNPKVLPLLDWLNQGKFDFIPMKLRDKLSKFLVVISQYHNISQRSWNFITGLSFLENMLGIITLYLLAISLNIDITFISLGWIRSVINLITTLPISFSGIGVREGGLVVLLEPYGVAGSEAVALSFLILASAVLVGGIGGVIEARQLLLSTNTNDIKA
jgi:uncharacterized protein (TIRG00374 family)